MLVKRNDDMKIQKREIQSAVLVLALMGSGIKAYSMPTIYPGSKSQLATLKNDTDSTIVAETTRNDHYWVLPPDNVYAYATNFGMPTTNLGFCKEMAGLQKVSDSFQANIDKLSADQMKFEEEANVLENRYYQLKADAERRAVSSDVLTKYSNLMSTLINLRSRNDEIRAQLKDCNQDYACANTILAEININNKEIAKTEREIRNNTLYQSDEVLAYDRAVKQANAVLEQSEKVRSRASRIFKDVTFIRDQLKDAYKSYGGLEGGVAQLSFESEWDNNIKKIREQNQDKAASFDKMQVNQVKFYASVIPNSSSSYLSTMPAVLDYRVNGRQGADVLEMEGYPKNLSGVLRLSLIGACPIAYPKLFQSENFKNGKMLMNLSTEYSFNSSFNTNFKYTYNETHFFERVVKSGSSGGFFSSESWSEVRDRTIDTKTVAFDWSSSDPELQMDFAARRKFEREVMDLILVEVIKKSADQAEARTVTASPAPVVGAIVISNGLRELCGSHIICNGGSWAFKVLASIFGSSTSTGTGSVFNQVTQTFTIDENVSHPVVRMTTYSTERKDQ
jgi:hypothetical protein